MDNNRINARHSILWLGIISFVIKTVNSLHKVIRRIFYSKAILTKVSKPLKKGGAGTLVHERYGIPVIPKS